MDDLMLTHLSVKDVNDYLLGHPAASRLANIEKHCRNCAECLEQMCAMAAGIDQTQLAKRPEALLLPEVPSVAVAEVKPRPPSALNYSWALKAVAAGVVLMAVPETARFAQVDHLFDSQLQASTLQLPNTRTLPEELVLVTAPKVKLPVVRNRGVRKLHHYPTKQFQAPLLETEAQLVEVALVDPPILDVTENVAELVLIDFETPQAEIRSKPGIFKRLLSAVASPFRSPRT